MYEIVFKVNILGSYSMGSNLSINQLAGFGNDDEGIINTSIVPSNIPTSLPVGLSWKYVNEADEIYDFLKLNYVEDDDSQYKLIYSKEFISYMLSHPNHKPQYSLGLYTKDKLIGYIMGRPHTLSIFHVRNLFLSVNFLCVDCEYKNYNYSTFLIAELTRLANLEGIFLAIFTSQNDTNVDFTVAQYYHYPINLEKLVATGLISENWETNEGVFCRESTRIVRKDSLDIRSVKILFEAKSSISPIHERMDFKTIENVFSTREDVIITIFNEKFNEFASFYIVDILAIESNTTVKKASLYYWFGSFEIILEALTIAKEMGVDMFDLINIAENKHIINYIKFCEGTGKLKYHFFNFKKNKIPPGMIDFMLF